MSKALCELLERFGFLTTSEILESAPNIKLTKLLDFSMDMYYKLLNSFMLAVFLFYILKLRREVKALSKLTQSQFQTLINSAHVEFPNEQLFDEHFKQRVLNGLIRDPKKYVIEKTGCSEAQADHFVTQLVKKQ